MVSPSAKYSIFHGIIAVLVVISVGFAVMSSSSPLSSGQVAKRAALVTDGSIDDNGWGLLHHRGLLALKDELGFEIALSELLPPAEWETAPRSYAENQYDYVLLAGGQFTTIAAEIAPDYPDTTFIVTAAAPPAEGTSFPSNMIGIDLMNEQSAYLGGILAAGMTKTNKIGAIGGIDFPYLLRWNEAFKLGAVTQNPNVTIFEAYTGSFEDVSRGYEATKGQIDAGADVIWHNLDLGAVGVLNAVEESPGVWLISNTNDQSFQAPEVTLTSTLQNMTNLILNGVKGVESGTLNGGEFHRWGIKEGAAGLAPYHQTEGMIPADLKTKIEDLKMQMANGTFTVPLIYETDGYRNYT